MNHIRASLISFHIVIQLTCPISRLIFLASIGSLVTEREVKACQTNICNSSHYTLMVILDISKRCNIDLSSNLRLSYLENNAGEILSDGNSSDLLIGNGNCRIISHADSLVASKYFGDGYI